MICNGKKCDKCGLYWTVTTSNPTGGQTEKKMCAFIALYQEQVKTNQLMVGLRGDRNTRENRAIKILKGLNGQSNSGQG